MQEHVFTSLVGQWESLRSPAPTYEGLGKGSEGEPLPRPYGIVLSNTRMSSGTVRVKCSFSSLEPKSKWGERSSCGIIFGYRTEGSRWFIAEFGGHRSKCCLTEYMPAVGAFVPLIRVGTDASIVEHVEYELALQIDGQRVEVLIDGVRVFIWELSATAAGQIGLHAFGNGTISFKDFEVEPREKRAFLVMPFSDELTAEYLTVKLAESGKSGFKIERADESPNPGKITAEILECIEQSDAVIGVLTWTQKTFVSDSGSSVSRPNENVYYELGYAHALRKPTILVALKDTNLPFDLRVDKVIFYERTTCGLLALRTAIDHALQSIAEL